MMMRGGREIAYGRGGISIQRHLAELQVKILSKHTFKIGVAILTSLMRDRYSIASRFEQRQMYATVSRVATLLTTQFTGVDYWMVGLTLFQAAASVITQLDELMHMRACIDLSHKFLGDERQRKDVLAAAATISRSSVICNSPTANEPLLQAHNALTNLISEEIHQQMEGDTHQEEPGPEVEPNPEPIEEDLDMRLARAMTMEELSMEIQAVLHRVNQTFAGRSRALAEEFIGLQEAIQATLHVQFNEINNAPRGPPPAAKKEIKKLSIVIVTNSVLVKIGEGTQCAVCREVLVVGDIIQEMPCMHPYHPDCLKPWLEKHNSCPICRFELQTDDEEYERKKQQDQEVEEQRRWVQIALKEDELLNM